MIEHRPYAAIGGTDLGWLKARWHVAVGGLGRPQDRPIGALRAWNDDEMAADSGFPMHHHRDVEILTYVRSGAVSHQDSLGNRGVVRAGDVQAMSAGSGIEHAEYNDSGETTTLYQIWLQPRSRGTTPSWSTRRFPRAARAGTLVVLASGYAEDCAKSAADGGALPIDANARLLGATLRRGDVVSHPLGPGRQAYIVSTLGRVDLNGLRLSARDGAAVSEVAIMTITALDHTEIVLVELG